MQKPEISAFEQGIKLLARREHSRRELALKLAQRGYDGAEIDETIDVLEQKRYLSDARFCEAYINSRRNRGFGPVRIRIELESKGVDDELVQQSLDMNSAEWLALARVQYRKRFGADAPQDQTERARRARFLLQKGFLSDQIRVAMKPGNEAGE